MRNFVFRIIAVSSYLVLFFVACWAFFAISFAQSNFQNADRSPMLNGDLDLSAVNLYESSSVALSGEWCFYWQKLYSPSEIKQHQNEAALLRIPQTWQSGFEANQDLPAKGHATYHTTVTLDKPYEYLALRIPQLSNSHKLFVNGQLVSEAGKVSDNVLDFESGYRPQIVRFKVPNEQLEIVLQIANYDFYWGGVWQTPRLGTPQQLQNEAYLSIVKTIFVVSVFFTICAFNFIQFSLRTRDITPLIIALLSLILAIRELETSQILFLIYDFVGDFSIVTRVNYLSFYWASSLSIWYCYLCYRKEFHKPVVKLFILIPLLFSIVTLITPTEIFSHLLPVAQVNTLLTIAYVMYGLALAKYRKRKNSGALLLGASLLSLFSMNDILLSFGLVNSVHMVGFGLIAFVLCQNYITYKDFVFTSNDNTRLNLALEQRNLSLEKLSASLEEQVKSRTEELKSANQKLQSLANHDPLTGLANRRGLQVHLDSAYNQLLRKQTPFCLILIDFDYFKVVNDQFGHEVGDRVLVEGSKLMQSVLRQSDHLGRWGGEEFLLLCQHTNSNEALLLAEKLRNIIFSRLSEIMQIKISITAGVGQVSENENLDACINRVDHALYKGKAGGRNRVELALSLDSVNES